MTKIWGRGGVADDIRCGEETTCIVVQAAEIPEDQGNIDG